MHNRRVRTIALWTGGLLLALWLLFQLAVTLFNSTDITVDARNREAAAQTTLGNLNCRKELRAAFPFVTLTCQDVSRSPRESSSAPP